MNNSTNSHDVRNNLQYCITCTVFFWLLIVILCYVAIINAALMYGLMKTTREFKNPQRLQFMLAVSDLVTVLFEVTMLSIQRYVIFKYKVLAIMVNALINMLFLSEIFIIALMVFSRYITISYPFQNNTISKFVNRKKFVLVSVLVYTLGYGLLEIAVQYMKIPTMFFCVIFNWICSTVIVMFNILSIVKLRNNSVTDSTESRKSAENHTRAIQTLSMIAISTICLSLPNNVYQMMTLVLLFEKNYKLLIKLLNYFEAILLLYLLGMGVNSHIVLCRSSKIMKLLKKNGLFHVMRLFPCIKKEDYIVQRKCSMKPSVNCKETSHTTCCS